VKQSAAAQKAGLPAPAVVDRAVQWIRQRNARWFAWVHLYDPHAPYRPPPPFDREYADRPYYGEVAAADQALAPLLAAGLFPENAASLALHQHASHEKA
jgi:hypothetical protein